MSIDAAHRRWWQIFEVVFGIPFLAAIALHLVLPFSLPRGLLASILLACGAALMLIGTILIVLARRELARHGQPTDPGRPTSLLVTTGVFAYSRNPLYLGGICIVAGIALVFNLPWVLVLLLPALVGCHAVLVVPEERYLTATFGDEYRTYAATVHRWIGRTRRPGTE
jgi:protein-S-isoprenylcysteine O-methyltransferase Ste14